MRAGQHVGDDCKAEISLVEEVADIDVLLIHDELSSVAVMTEIKINQPMTMRQKI